MAKRKKTPDVLAGQNPRADEPTPPGARKRQASTDQSSPDASRQVKEESSNPFAVLFPLQPVEKLPTVSTRVKLEVTAFDDLTAKVQHCMSQALSALPYMQLVQDGADWTLIILGVPIQPPGGKIYGIALSAVATKAFDRVQVTESHTDQESRTDFTPVGSTIPARVFRGTWLRIGALVHLQRLCEQLVNDFNRRYLNPPPPA